MTSIWFQREIGVERMAVFSLSFFSRGNNCREKTAG